MPEQSDQCFYHRREGSHVIVENNDGPEIVEEVEDLENLW